MRWQRPTTGTPRSPGLDADKPAAARAVTSPVVDAALLAVTLAATLVVHGGVIWCFFWADDIVYLYDARNGEPLEFLLTPYGGHLSWVRNLLFLVLERSVAHTTASSALPVHVRTTAKNSATFTRRVASTTNAQLTANPDKRIAHLLVPAPADR